MKVLKKIVALFLVAIMLLSSININAFAEAFINTSVVTKVIAKKDNTGNDIVTAKTGESLTVELYSYNDNPNATAVAKVRYYFEQVSKITDNCKVEPKNKGEIIFKGEKGGKATTIKANWNSENDIDFLEFELPAGASVSAEIELTTKTGYDKEIKVDVYGVYSEKNSEGEYTEFTSKSDSEVINLTWSGDFNWSGFAKTSTIDKVTYIQGEWGEDSVTYNFSLTNNMAEETVGVIYTDSVTLKDTLTLPEGLEVPAGAVQENNQLKDGNDVIYKIDVADYDFTLNKLTKTNNTIEYEITIQNPDVTNMLFNPIGNVEAILNLNNLDVTDVSAIDKAEIINSASVDVQSVLIDNNNTLRETYANDATTKFEITTQDDLILKKSVVSVRNELDQTRSEKETVTLENGDTAVIPVVHGQDKVIYKIELTNPGTKSRVINLTDTMSKHLVFDENEFTVKIGNEAVQVTTNETMNNDERVITFSEFTLNPNETATITYEVDVDLSNIKESLPTGETQMNLKNIAAVGDLKSEQFVRTPEEGEINVTKQIISRTTTLPDGNIVKIYRNLIDNKIYTTGPINYLMGNSITQATLEKELLKFNAGDYIEYLVTVENETFEAVAGNLQDFCMFTPGSSAIANVAGNNYSYGSNYYFNNGIQKSVTLNTENEFSNCIYKYDDLQKNATEFLHQRNFVYVFSESNPLNAKSIYRQTFVTKIPGDNTKHMGQYIDGQNINDLFNKSVKYYRATKRMMDASNNYAVRAYALWTQTSSSNRIETEHIYHTIDGLESISTGVLATTKVDNISNIQDKEIKTYYVGTSASDMDSDLTIFENDENEVVVNYIYVYNNSPEKMELNNKNITVILPNGFKWLGFVTEMDRGSDQQGGFYYFNIGRTLDTEAYKNQSIVYPGLVDGDSLTSISSLIFQTLGGPYPDSNNANWFNVTTNTSSSSVVNLNLRPKTSGQNYINPYTGLLICYAAVVEDTQEVEENSKVYFSAMLQNTDRAYIKQAANDMYVTNMLSLQGFQLLKSNRGNTNSMLTDADNNLLKASENITYTGVDALHEKDDEGFPSELKSYYNMWSTVGLDIYKENYNINVLKEVKENKGVDENKDLDGYTWNYILSDGIHRTVDGTVTWDVSIENKEVENEKAQNINYGVLIDTIDSPYTLSEISIPNLSYYVLNNTTKKLTFNNKKIILPEMEIEEQSGNLIVNAPNWTMVEENKVYSCAFNLQTQSLHTTVNNVYTPTVPLARITMEIIPNGTIGYGYDVDSVEGDNNTWAVRYIIEFSKVSASGLYYEPLILPGETFNMSLTFNTTDSIETNYNSFAVVLKDTTSDDTDLVNVVDNGRVRKAYENHIADSKMNSIAQAGAQAAAGSANYVYEPYGSSSGPINYYKVNLADNLIVEYSDWTDTSYTDGEKTIKYTDANNEEHEITSRGDNLVLPGAIGAGTLLHQKLMVESVLYEAENYDYFTDLVIYDLYGVEEGTYNNVAYEARLGYNVDFETIQITDSEGNTLVKGTDYDIEYTKENLVKVEHHPISPVNTLTYAADWSKYNTVEWIQYDVNNADKDGTDARGFRIVLKDNAKTIYRTQNDYKIYVDYDAIVADDVENGVTYPSVEAYTASVHVEGDTRLKDIFEDTTAVEFKGGNKTELNIQKSVRNSKSDISESVDEEFKFLAVKVGYAGRVSLINATVIEEIVKIDGIAPGELTNTEPKAKLIYSKSENITEPQDIDYKDFFEGNYSYRIFEIPSENYRLSSIEMLDSEDITLDTQTTDFEYMSNIVTADEEVNNFFSECPTVCEIQTAVINKAETNNYIANLKFTNRYSENTYTINKIDENGDAIDREVTFEIYDSNDELVKFTKRINRNETYYREALESDTDVVTDLTFTAKAYIEYILPGEYKIVEKSAPTGYKADEPTIFTAPIAASNDRIINIVNKIDEDSTAGKLVINKVDEDTQKLIKDNNAIFEIYDSNQNGSTPLYFVPIVENENIVKGSYKLVQDANITGATTELATANGVLNLSELQFKTYYIVEKNAPLGYELSGNTLQTATQATLDIKDLQEEVTIKNKIIDTNVIVEKIDNETKESITSVSAEFNLLDENGDKLRFFQIDNYKYVLHKQGLVDVLKTDPETGKFEIAGMPEGEYELKETKAPNGYKLSNNNETISITKNETLNVQVENEKEVIKLKVNKVWKSEGVSKERPFEEISFVLYEQESSNTAKQIETAITNEAGKISFTSNLDLNKKYYLVEQIPTEYSIGNDDVLTLMLKDEKLYLDVQLGENGYTAIEAFEIDLKNNLSELNKENDIYVFEEKVINIRENKFGGKYASVAYKTIDNYKTAEKYGIEKEKGYSFYYEQEDYDAGNYNYVHAVTNGDIVTYTLNIKNVSYYDFKKLVIIDRMPEVGDTGVVNLNENRGSEFAVANSDNEEGFIITIDGELLDSSKYKVEFSKNVKFTEEDFDGVSQWSSSNKGAKSFRIVFADDIIIKPDDVVVVTYDGTIQADAKPGQIAWNDFAYRYVAVDEDTENTLTTEYKLTPEPPKVGVKIIEKTVDDDEKETEEQKSSETQKEEIDKQEEVAKKEITTVKTGDSLNTYIVTLILSCISMVFIIYVRKKK